MGIVGIGADVLEVRRMAEAGERFGERFYQRLFTPAEIAYCESRGNPSEHYAARFAAKEAALKALGAGWAKGVSWKDVEVVRRAEGPPALRLSGAAGELAKALGVRRAHLSLSHTRDLALANVVLEGDPAGGESGGAG